MTKGFFNNITFYMSSQVQSAVLSINDLMDKYYNNEVLSDLESKAISRYNSFRIKYLNSQPNEEAFDMAYTKLQAMANLSDYKEFLKEDYDAAIV
jgi:hypothetical protein